ncbi:hypothetical protein EDD16DRAFT_1632801 [Pisolithus croceorrhizus]|nr:hypothetical protein EDD16DRAFT_1632801 [Pisolithus croceorrhizus]KAI6162831.1 hypothetical protein EDD17DRAFT_528597 [Pisolithus thermaeus]
MVAVYLYVFWGVAQRTSLWCCEPVQVVPSHFFQNRSRLYLVLRPSSVPLQIDTEAPQWMVPLGLQSVSTLLPSTLFSTQSIAPHPRTVDL